MVSTTFDSAVSELATHLTSIERNLLHIIREHLRVGNETLLSYNSNLSNIMDDPGGSSRSARLGQLQKNYLPRFKELIENFNIVEGRLQSFLDGKPIDIYYIKSPIEERERECPFGGSA